MTKDTPNRIKKLHQPLQLKQLKYREITHVFNSLGELQD